MIPFLFFCQAQCFNVDLNARTAENRGQAYGYSRLDVVEAFQIMDLDCRAHGGNALVKSADLSTGQFKIEFLNLDEACAVTRSPRDARPKPQDPPLG